MPGIYTLTQRPLVLRDAPQPLHDLFRDSHAVFRMRVHKLGKISSPLTLEDSEALRIMLETLIQTKRTLQDQA
jgi:hypothetical protein